MAQLIKAGAVGALDHRDTTQAGFRDQIAAVATSLRQVFGNGDFSATDATQALLTSRYTLYVDPTIGRDDYEAGIENGLTEPPLLSQQLACGYSPHAPFKTIQRALIEAARISVEAGPDNDEYDRVVIHVAAGEHVVDNSPSASINVKPWADIYQPTQADLRGFNASGSSGIILPRGVSIIGEDLRKTVIRPAYVPAADGDPSTGRGAIFRSTGGGFFFNFTFKDTPKANSSHHLLHCFEFCSETDLRAYYNKVAVAFSGEAGEIRPGETEIVAPYPDGVPDAKTDSTVGASCYVFNCSLRSDYGLCGMYLDGQQVTGFKSMVTAQFTNVSLQKDMQAWEVWGGGEWRVPATYQEYISADINNIRARVGGELDLATGCYEVDYRNFGFKCIRDAIIQEVSCFVIGDSVHHWTASGGECTITNSNSNFGMTALLSNGFKGIGTPGGAFDQDRGFLGRAIKRPLRVKQDGTNIRQLNLGKVSSYDPTTGKLTLETPVDVAALARSGYSLRDGNYIWVENRSRETGPGAIPGDVPNSSAINARAQMAETPWVEFEPTSISLRVDNNNNVGTISAEEIVGNRVFIRRLVDNRTPEEREYSLVVSNSNITSTRRPVGNYVLRIGARTSVEGQLDPSNGADEVFIVTESAITSVPSAAADTGYYKLLIRAGDQASSYAPGTFYRVGSAVFHDGRVQRSKLNGYSDQYEGQYWENSFSMLPSVRGVETGRAGIAPSLVIDKDLSNDPDSHTLGIDLDADEEFLLQLRSTADFLAISHMMLALGYSQDDLGIGSDDLKGKIMQPQPNNDLRYWDPSDDTSPSPNGKLTDKEAWPLEFNRPSLIRAFGHAYEWVGQSNYTKAMPKYQSTALTDQHKIDFFGVSHMGGRVYNTGFNEDGLLVQGDTIRDLATNRSVNTETAGLGALSGDPDFEGYFPTEFDTLTVTKEFNSAGQSNLNNVTINGVVTGSPVWEPGTLPLASTAQRGIIEIATAAEVKDFVSDTLAVTPSTLIEALGDAVKSVVNLRLSLSASRPWPDTNQADSKTIYVHPYAGNEVALYNNSLKRWQVIRFSGIKAFSLSALTSGNTNYDVYIYNSGTANAPVINLDYAPWPAPNTLPTRTEKDGVLCKNGNPERRFIGVIRTTTPGTSTINLGGTIPGYLSADYPRIFLANLYNGYEASMRYFFGNSWNTPGTNYWAVPPASVYGTAPRCAFVQGAAFMATAFLDIYNNPGAGGSATMNGSIAYVAPGINSTTSPPEDAFYGECAVDNSTAGSQWARSVPAGLTEIYYLYRQLGGGSSINEHPAHGMIVTCKV